MSVVKFLCPSGHPLNAPLNLVGKAGKCPKCGTAFVVPAPEPEEAAATQPAPTGRLAEAGGGAGLWDLPKPDPDAGLWRPAAP